MPYDKNLSVEPISSEHFSLEYGQQASEIYEIATRRLPMVRAATLRKRSADAQVKASRSANTPVVYFNSSLASNYSNSARDPFNQSIPYFQQYSNNLSKSFSVSVAVPLFNSFRTKNTISLSRISQRENEALLQNTLVQLQQAVEQAYFNMISAKERYQSLTEQVNAYKESFRTVEIRFNAGALTVVEYLIAKNNLDRANTNLLVNRYDLLLRKKILDFYQGETLHF
jgi:outer membrane protein